MDLDLDLDGLLAEALAGSSSSSSSSGNAVGGSVASPQWPSGAAKSKDQAIAKIAYTHDAMIDLLIANPAMSQNSLAAAFGYTPSWISQVMSSDAFQMRMAERREQIVDPTLRLTVKQNFESLVRRSIEILQVKLNQTPDKVPDGLALRVLDIGGKLAGYGVKEPPPIVPVNPTEIHLHLEQLGGGLVALLQRRKLEAADAAGDLDAIEGDYSDISKAIEHQQKVKSA